MSVAEIPHCNDFPKSLGLSTKASPASVETVPGFYLSACFEQDRELKHTGKVDSITSIDTLGSSVKLCEQTRDAARIIRETLTAGFIAQSPNV